MVISFLIIKVVSILMIQLLCNCYVKIYMIDCLRHGSLIAKKTNLKDPNYILPATALNARLSQHIFK